MYCLPVPYVLHIIVINHDLLHIMCFGCGYIPSCELLYMSVAVNLKLRTQGKEANLRAAISIFT